MNSFLSLLIISGVVLSEQTRYWSLGVATNIQPKKKIIQKEIDLNTFVVDLPNNKHKSQSAQNIYTLKTNYFIAPETIKNKESGFESNELKNINIKDLILEEEYFKAAKQILYLEQTEKTLEQFQDWDDFYYWSSFVYYNLGNYSPALENIEKVSSQETGPETLFLKALINQDNGNTKESNVILNKIIQEFPNNDYASYAKDILNDE